MAKIDTMADDEKRRLLTQIVPVPREVLLELSTDGGMQGITNLLKEDGWDEVKPTVVGVHKLDRAASLAGSKWATQVNVSKFFLHVDWILQGRVAPVMMKAKNVWPGMTKDDVFITVVCEDLDTFK